MNRTIPEERIYEALMMFTAYISRSKTTMIVGYHHPSTNIMEPLFKFMDVNGIKKPAISTFTNYVQPEDELQPTTHFGSMFAFRHIHYGCIGCGLEMEIWNATEKDPPKTILCEYCGDYSFLKHAEPVHFHEDRIRKSKWFTHFNEADAIKTVNDLLDNAELKIMLLNRKAMFEKLAEYIKNDRLIIKLPFQHCGTIPKKFSKTAPVLK